jgi:hypothetical protein
MMLYGAAFARRPLILMDEPEGYALTILDRYEDRLSSPAASQTANPPSRDQEIERVQLELAVLDTSGPGLARVVGTLDLLPYFAPVSGNPFDMGHYDLFLNSLPGMHYQAPRLHLHARQPDGSGTDLVIDLSDPQSPRYIESMPSNHFGRWIARQRNESGSGALDGFELPPDLPGRTVRERLEAYLALGIQEHNVYGMTVEGDLMAATRVLNGPDNDLRLYRIVGLTAAGGANGEVVQLELLSIIRRPIIQRILEPYTTALVLRDGILWDQTTLAEGGVTAYDVRDPRRPRRIGHFTSPRDRSEALAALPGGRAMALGRQIHIIGPVGRAF